MIYLSGCSAAGQSSGLTWAPKEPPDLGQPVARIGGVPLFGHQVVAEARRQGTTLKAALDRLVEQSLLAEVARAHGHWPPEASDDVEDALVQRLLERDIEPGLRLGAIPDAALRPLYDRVRDIFVHGRIVEVGLLAIYTGARMKDAALEERRQTASELAAYVAKKKPRTLEDFLAIGAEDNWKSRHVVARRLMQSLDRPMSRKIGEEIVKLRAIGQTTPLLTDEDGFFIARYIDEHPPENITFEQARPKLAEGYFERWRRQRFLEVTTAWVQQHRTEAYYDRLTKNDQGP
jgi:hypothetical protein